MRARWWGRIVLRGGSASSRELQHLFVEGITRGGDQTIGVVGPGASGEVSHAASSLRDEEDGGGVVPDSIAGTDRDIEVARREPGPPDAGTPDRAHLPAVPED